MREFSFLILSLSVPTGGSDFHQFLVLLGKNVIDLLDVGVGELLDVGLAALLLILGNGLVLEQRLDSLVGVAADVAHCDLALLGLALHDLGELLAAILGKGRKRNED